jgi:hypothetical protein
MDFAMVCILFVGVSLIAMVFSLSEFVALPPNSDVGCRAAGFSARQALDVYPVPPTDELIETDN